MSSDNLPSSDHLPPAAEPKKAFPAFVEVKGYQDFPVLEELFYQEYIDTPLIDVRGIRIHFHARKPNNFRDFEHAAVGKEGLKGARPEPCDLRRASCCIHWIRFVVTHPDVEIFRSSNGVPPDQERDIYRWKRQEAPGQIFHYYQVVVTRYLNAPEKNYFLTAYPLDFQEYAKIASRNRRVPVPRPQTERQGKPVTISGSAVKAEGEIVAGAAAPKAMEQE